ncbi:MAG TPA: hypothetical protein ENJ82_00875, partial [Bacteroidetes bacterium]|nr:hypothetical protein [Bacteroidota bacterium]
MKRPLPTGILVALICSPFFLFPSLFAQVITNGDLNGNVGVSSTPFSWTQVPNTASFSFASGPLQATSDVTSLSGPLPSAGINGNPYTGTTLVSGLKMRSGATYFWHEGIRQTVFGFTPGNAYTVTFYQTVVKQSNVQDNTGLWDLYLDNTFIASSSPTTSTLVFNSNNLPWEQKQISFTATSTAHTLSFMPGDDDANVVGMDGVRMGIDNISLSTAVVLPVSVTLNASLISGGVQLDWEVGNNVQADRYFLERSV